MKAIPLHGRSVGALTCLLLTVLSVDTRECQAVTVKVPTDQSSIQNALGVPGVDLIQVAGTHTNLGAITINVSGVRIERDPGSSAVTPTINAQDASSAVTMNATAAISGFKIISSCCR